MENDGKVTVNRKDDFLHVQESMVNLLIRVSAVERLLHEKGILTEEEYKKAIELVGTQVTAKLKQLYSKEQIDNITTKDKPAEQAK